jgi:hypothetical protein
MTAVTSRINAAISYLVTQATSTWGSDQQTHVFDGPTPADFNLEAPSRVWIGADPTKLEAAGDDAVTGDRGVATLTQGRALNETFEITCAVEHWDGGTDLAEARSVAFGYWSTFENFVRGLPPVGPGDTTLGGALGSSGWAQIAGGVQVHQEQQPSGCDVVIVFRVSCIARLTA